MKKRNTLLAILAILLFGLLWWWFWWPAPQSAQQRALIAAKARADARLIQAAAASASGSIPSGIGKPIGQNPANGQVEVRINPALPDADKMQMILSAQNGRQIDFYGKVVDQYGAPVVGAKVRGVIVFSSVDGTNNQDNYTVTDGKGLFKFNNLHGPNFGAVPSKDGYEYNERQSNNWSESYKPDPANPIVFPMYKLQGAEPMAHSIIASWIPYDGTPITFDLFAGKKRDTGDLKITLIRDPLQVIRGQTHFDWAVKIEIAGGGLVESQDTYPYEAPGSGYLSFFEFTVKKDDPNWTQRLTKDFYIFTSKSQYGRIHVDLTTDSERTEGTGFEAESYVNLSGSRNLEWDPAKEISPP